MTEKKDELSFEEAMDQLEGIVEKLETGRSLWRKLSNIIRMV